MFCVFVNCEFGPIYMYNVCKNTVCMQIRAYMGLFLVLVVYYSIVTVAQMVSPNQSQYAHTEIKVTGYGIVLRICRVVSLLLQLELRAASFTCIHMQEDLEKGCEHTKCVPAIRTCTCIHVRTMTANGLCDMQHKTMHV